jgi:predicted AlkP superfamily phosphohydrolase/phosphomutase
MNDRPRVLAVSLDALDAELAFRWAQEGELPVIRQLVDDGASARLHSIADDFPDAIFATIASGCLPGKHGHYNWRCLRPGSYRMVLAPEGTYRRPYWELAHEQVGARLVLADVQQAPPLCCAGVTQIAGWGQRAGRRHDSWPPELFDEVVARHGRSPQWLDDDVVRRSEAAEARYHETVMRFARARADLYCELLQRQPWDLAVLSFHEAHNAGHVFHRYLQPGTWAYDEARARRFRDSLLDVYRLVDEGLGRLLEQAGTGTDVLVYAGHGFRLNTNGVQLLPRVLERLGYQVPARAAPLPRLLNAVAQRVPWSIRRHVNRRLSPELQRRALERMWAESVDWAQTRAVAETAFGLGWVRVNLRGREPSGTVSPGREQDELCAEIASELESLTLVRTGGRAVSSVRRMDAVVSGPSVGELPDLVVRFTETELVDAVAHPRVGIVHESRNDLTSAEHEARGFVLARGPRIRPGAAAAGSIVDLAPTILYLTGAVVPDDMDGAVLEWLIDPAVLESEPPRRAALEWSNDPWAQG